MEALSNVATAASKTVFGDQDAKKEPVSGVQGDVSHGQPYDAGNLDSKEQGEIEKELSTEDVTTTDKATTEPSASKDADKTETTDKPEPTTQKTGGHEIPTLAADGGDFDATKPGAGKDAERILEQQGVGQGHQKTTSTETNEQTNGAESKSKHTEGKPSLGERIKAKLHRH